MYGFFPIETATLALDAKAVLEKDSIPTRVVSMPSTSVFDCQSLEYRLGVLGQHTRRVAIEAAQGDFWRKYVGLDGEVVSIDTFGASAPAGKLFEHFGFTVQRVVDMLKSVGSRSP